VVKVCCRWQELWASNARDGHSFRPNNTSDSGSSWKAMLGMVTSTDQAILKVVAATGKQCWGWSFVIAEESFDCAKFLSGKGLVK